MAQKKSVRHIHDDMDVTQPRLDAFATAMRAEQIATLAQLRAQAADESSSAKVGLASILIAVLVVVLAPRTSFDVYDQLRDNPLLAVVAVVVVAAVFLLALVPMFVDVVRDQNRRERATVWLAAFQDELARRHRLTGRCARRWQREH